MPARVRKPKDKALVEDAVKLTYARIYNMVEALKESFYVTFCLKPQTRKVN